MKSILAVLLLCLFHPVQADQGMIGGVTFEVPAPRQYASLAPSMSPAYEIQQNLIAPTNIQLFSYIPRSQMPAATAGRRPDLTRSFAVQTAKIAEQHIMLAAEFARLKASVAKDNADAVRRIKKNLPAELARASKAIEKIDGFNPALTLKQMIPLATHYQDATSISYSAFLEYGAQDSSGHPFTYVTSMTCTFLLLKGKLLFLYSYGSKDDLDWTQTESRAWVAAVRTAND